MVFVNMLSKHGRWETLEALKNSPKGKLSFDPHWLDRGEDILAGCKDTLSLSPHSGSILERISSFSPQKSFLVSKDYGSELSETPSSSSSSASDSNGKNSRRSAAPHNPTLDAEVKHESPGPECSQDPGPVSPPAISLLSPKAMETAGRILRFQEEQREKAKILLRQRQEVQERLVEEVSNVESEHLKRFEELTELKQRQEFQSMRDMMDRETKESMGRQEKLKEEQRHRIRILNLRLRELEMQRLREAELEKQRQAEGREKLRNLNTIQEEILQLNQLLEPSTQTLADLPPSSLSSYSSRGNQLCSQVSEVVRKTAQGEFPSAEDMTAAERALHDMRGLIRLMQQEVAEAQERKKQQQEQEKEQGRQQELQAQQEAQKKAQQLANEKAQKKGLQNSADSVTLAWFKELQDSAARCTQAMEPLCSSKDSQTNKLKLELQKAATIPVSQISSISGRQLREIFNKINGLLSGRSVVSGGRTISSSQHPLALNFISYKLAEKFVKQGEEEVASHHEAAFPIAVVASGIWELHPHVGDLILAHLHKKCPYAVPHYPPMKDGTPVEEYQRILGYRVDANGVEGQDSFLKRMSGMIRLYAAIIQLRWPFGSKQGSVPHGLDHGWRWLAQMLNMEPLVDVTATLLFDFLEVCGHALMTQYQSQFWKVLLLLKDEYFPRIEAVTSTGERGSMIRLKQFLETSLQRRHISPPKGQLTSSFWTSSE
ncbi:nucleoporin GLE1 [Oryzias latipes]|uniref:nucleoporin GLE1 n=1 Tax=Oryzias latipes TaxID=8090 RepID=UPI0002A483F6|nr:nucleoporin GLE1 [Oryzias latipes]